MTKRLSGRPLLLGIVGAVVVSIGLFFAFTKSIPFVHGYQVEAVFQNSSQLRVGSPVRIAGVDVGTVASRELGKGDTSVFTLELKDSGRPVREDAELTIRPRLFLEGSYYVELKPGSPSAPELDEGDTIPLPQTATPVQFNQILSTLPTDTRGALADAVDELGTALSGGGAEGLARTAKPLTPVLRDTATIADASRGSEPQDVTDLVRGTGRITSALVSRDDDLADLITNLNTTSGVLAVRNESVAATLRNLDGTMREAPGALSALDRALPPTREFVAATRPSLRLLPPILDDTNALLVQLRGLFSPSELNGLLDDLQPTLRGLPSLTERLRVLLGLVTPVADCLRERAIPVLNSKLDDGALSTGQPVYLELLHGLTGLTAGVQTFDGNGLSNRFLGSFGEGTVSIGPVGGLGTLFGSGTDGPVGSSPAPLPLGQVPPFRPDAECRKQAAPDLGARNNGPATPSTTSSAPRASLPAGGVEQLLRDAVKKAGR